MLSQKNKIKFTVIGLILVGLAAGFLDFPQIWDPIASTLNIKNFTSEDFPPFRLGLDLQGGTHLVYQADISGVPDDEQSAALEGVRDVIERRVNAFGVSEPIVQTSRSGDKWRIIVELAGISDVNQAINMIGETPLLEFKQLGEPKVPTLNEDQQKEVEEFNRVALENVQGLLKRALSGEDFATLAQEFSQDEGSAAVGGSIGWAQRGILVAEYEQAIFEDLAVGQISKELVQSQFGFHIIKKDDQRGGAKPDGTDDTEVASSHILIKTKSALDYFEGESEWEYTGLTGKHLKRSQVEFDQNTGIPEVALEFNDEGAELFATLTEENIGNVIGIFLDGEVISAPVVNEKIPSGRAVISGGFDIPEAKLLKQRLNAGALPVPINLISQETIGASLGNLSVEKSLIAAIIGLLLVAAFMLLYYRLLGVVADVSLVFYGVILLALFKLIPVTLTLAGIAGFILSLGMAVDANVLVFERIKEELRRGKTIGIAIDEGFRRAWPSIRDGNVSTLITCFILMWFSTSLVKGFAITLSIGVIVSMFSAMIVTKSILKIFLTNKISQTPWLFGVKGKIEEIIND
ncbi:protein translocase subunit SecD [Patescibacteria group bacterium]|nr:protein translocase subunit SecD [Patescibacteria group bacterium]